jgi:hypothetical protein
LRNCSAEFDEREIPGATVDTRRPIRASNSARPLGAHNASALAEPYRGEALPLRPRRKKHFVPVLKESSLFAGLQ